MRPTRRGVAVLITAAALLVSGWWLRYPLLTVLGATGFGSVAAALLVARRDPRIEATRTINPGRVERGGPASASLSVRDPRGPLLFRDRIAGRVVVVDTTEYRLPTDVRGRFTVGPLEAGREDPLGLARGWHRAGGFTTLTVYPRQRPARPGGGPSRSAAPGPAADDLWPGSAEPRGVREYAPGDEVRHLHWKATAHTGRLMVRELADPRRAALTVLLDTRAGALAPDDFEEAVDVAASLLGSAAAAGVRTRLFTAGGHEVPEHPLEALVELRQDDERTLAAGATGGRLVLITGGATAPARLGPPFSDVVVVALGGGVGAEQALRRWNEGHR
ncbi:DUF58 domain-containing protein [Actinoplanes sp. NPDC049596]|uniref:DUF58 domain-containing protein n=1 Tax=unclassified Actinoplanes TaxID=2626549 RepID=UPI00341B1AB9